MNSIRLIATLDDRIRGAALLRTGGPLASSLGDVYEARPEQVAMAEAVARRSPATRSR